jgi:hypothetical protein
VVNGCAFSVKLQSKIQQQHDQNLSVFALLVTSVRSAGNNFLRGEM